MNSKILRQRIISALIQSDGLSISQLTERTSASRVSVSKELQSLKFSEIVEKEQGSRSHTLSSKIAFVIFKIYQDSAELLTYSLDRATFSRERIDLVYSLSYEDNINFLSQRIDRCRKSLQKQFKRVITCIIHERKIAYTPSVLRTFDFAELRSELVAKQIEYTAKSEAVLYINNAEPISFLCQDGHAVTPSVTPNEKALSAFQNSITLIKPSRVILEGKEHTAIATACAKHNIPFRLIEPQNDLSLDERAMIEEALLALSKENINEE